MAVALIGPGDFTQTAPERWVTNGWDLDRLLVPFRGWWENLDDFLSGFTPWESSDIDGDMFLFEISSSDQKRFPTVELIYMGKMGGDLPDDKNIQQQSVQQVRYVGYGDPTQPPLASGYLAPTPGVDPQYVGTVTLDITYTSLAKGIITWARDDGDLDINDIGNALGFDGEYHIDFSSREVTMSLENWPPNWPVLDPHSEGDVTDLLFVDTIITGDIEELVPEQYFKATAMVQTMLFPDPPIAG